MKILLMIDGLTLPAREGISTHVYEVACSLADQQFEVIVAIADRGWASEETLQEAPFTSVLLPPGEYYDRRVITGLLNRWQPDLVQSYSVYFTAVVLGPVAYKLRIPVIIEHHDVEAALGDFLLDSPQKRAYNVYLQELATRYASAARVMSHDDYRQLGQDFPRTLAQKLFWLPVSIAGYGITEVFAASRPTAIFIGNTKYPPNAEAAQLIINTIAPAVPSYEFMLVGWGTDDFSASVRSHNVSLLGPQDDLRPLLQTAGIGLAPLVHGSGMKVKLLSYLAAGLPVIATPVAAMGYPNSPAIEVVATPADFIPALDRATKPGWKWAERSQAALQLFNSHFSAQTNARELAWQYRSIVWSPDPSVAAIDPPAIDQSRIYWLQEDRTAGHTPVKHQRVITGRAAA